LSCFPNWDFFRHLSLVIRYSEEPLVNLALAAAAAPALPSGAGQG